MPNGGVGSGILGQPGPGGWNRWEINFPIRDFLFGKMMDYVTRAKMIKKFFYLEKPNCLLGIFPKRKFDGLCKQAKNDEKFLSLEKHNFLFRKFPKRK